MIISKVEEGTFAEFLTSVAGLFEKCFHLRLSKKNKHLRTIELEKNFNACRTKSNPARKAWDEILLRVSVEKIPLLTVCTNMCSNISGALLDLSQSSNFRVSRWILAPLEVSDPQ